MDMTKRVLLAIGILAVDTLVFFLPLTALLLAYVLVFNPPWFRQLITELDPPDI
jgi:hypothetical protein